MHDKLFHQLLDSLLTFLAGLTPAALGAVVSLLYERGLTWGDRFVRLSVGVIVSFYAQRLIDAIFGLAPFVSQGVGFTLGMIAFKATPRFISAASDAIASMPLLLRDRVLALLPGKDRK